MQLKPKRWTKLHQFLHDDRGIRYFFASLGIIIATGVALLAMMAQFQQPSIIDTVAKVVDQKKYYSPLTGLEVPDEAATKQPVTAIMIENSPDARPQSGLKQAGVVYEAIAEGGITRFLALYQESKPDLIGPVRSLRPYFLEWAAPYDASIAHIGGSYKALQEVRSGSYRDIDQFFNADTYWRATDRWAPHNVYTNFKNLDELNNKKGYKTSNFKGFPREKVTKNPKTNVKKAQKKYPAAKNIDITVSSAAYNVNYAYDAEHNNYKRSQGGEPHTDREKGQITPSVAIAIKVPTELGFEDGWREQMQTTGSGEAFIFQNGVVIKGTWKKAGTKEQIQFLDEKGEQIPLVRGQTWITAIPTDQPVTWQ